jgi:hypothetical protein
MEQREGALKESLRSEGALREAVQREAAALRSDMEARESCRLELWVWRGRAQRRGVGAYFTLDNSDPHHTHLKSCHLFQTQTARRQKTASPCACLLGAAW